jgi:hypothetical protein
MRWVTGMAAGVFAGIAILAAVYGLNKVNDWHEHRVVALAHLAVLEGDPGYPNRDSNLRSEREQIDVLDREVRKSALISAIALVLSVGGFVPLWRKAVRSFGAVRLAVLAVITAAVFLSALALGFVMLSAGVIRG